MGEPEFSTPEMLVIDKRQAIRIVRRGEMRPRLTVI